MYREDKMALENENLELSTVPEESEFDSSFAEFAGGKDPVDIEVTNNDPKEKEVIDNDDKAKPVVADVVNVDPYANLSAEDRTYFEGVAKNAKDLQHRIDSDGGRVNAYQRQISDLQRTIQQASTPVGKEKPTMANITEAMKSGDEGWEQFTADYPDIARVIDSRFEGVGKAMGEAVESTLAPVLQSHKETVDTATTTAANEKVAAVSEVYPKWTEAVQTPEFTSWLAQQSPGIGALAESDYAADATSLIGMYDNYLVTNDLPTLKKTDPGPGVNTDGDKPEGSELSSNAKKRAEQLASGTSVASKSAGVTTGDTVTDDFDTAFNAFAARRERKRA
jgi:hypothetical protein